MAFMMPVMKNNYDIYKDKNRSRKTSEGSNSTTGDRNAISAAMGIPNRASRSRQVSECKSESFSSSPSHAYRIQMQRCQSSRAFPRNASRTSHSSVSGALSPTRSFSQASSPPKTATTGSQSDLSKFHIRLVEKLRKSFRKDSAKRS